MAIVVNDDTPEFLRQFLISQGVIEVKDTETGQTKIVPLPPRRRPVAEQDDGRTDDDFRGYQVASAASGSSPGLFSNLFSSDNTDPDFQAMLTDVANQSSSEQEPISDVSSPVDVEDYNLTMRTPDALMGTGLVGPSGSYKSFTSYNTEPQYQDLITKSRGQDFYDSMSQAAKSSNPFNQFTNFVNKTTNEISKGLFGDLNLLGQDRTGKGFIDRLSFGPGGRLRETFNDPYISDGQKAAEAIGMGIRGFVGMVNPFATPLGLFSMLAHAAGAHHPFDVTKDTDIFADPISGTMTWNTVDETVGGGGAQRGVLNMDNAIEDIANQNPNQFINTPLGYITAGNLNNAIKSGNFNEYLDHDVDLEGLGFSQTTPFGLDMFGNNNVSYQNALAEYNARGTGAIQNEAGRLADEFNLGYNQQQTIADSIAHNIQSSMDAEFDGQGGGDMQTIDGESYDAFGEADGIDGMDGGWY